MTPPFSENVLGGPRAQFLNFSCVTISNALASLSYPQRRTSEQVEEA